MIADALPDRVLTITLPRVPSAREDAAPGVAPTGAARLDDPTAPETRERRPELIGRGTAAGYTGAHREPGTVDIQEVVAVQTARGPE